MKMKRKLLSLVSVLTILLGAFWVTKIVKADQVTNYTNTASITKSDGTALSNDPSKAVNYWEPLSFSNSITFPDEVSIKAGDTLTIKLPEQLQFTTALTFDVMHTNGQLAGKATTDPNTGEVTVTFTDIFEKLPNDKAMTLNFNAQLNHNNISIPGVVNFNYNNVAYSSYVKDKDITPISPDVNKVGYQDKSNSGLIHWKVLINNKQGAIDNLTLTDVVGEDQEIVKDSLVAARLQYIAGDDVDSLDEAASRPYAEDFSKNVTYQINDLGLTTGFTYTIPGSSNNAIFISYTTRLTSSQSAGKDVSNTIAISGNNINYSNQTGYARIESAYGRASSRVKRQAETTTVTETTTSSSSETTTSEATTETSSTTNNNSTTTETATSTTGASTTQTKTTASQTNVPTTTNITTTSKQVTKQKAKFVLPSTGEQAGLLLTTVGLVIVAVAGVYFYRTRR